MTTWTCETCQITIQVFSKSGHLKTKRHLSRLTTEQRIIQEEQNVAEEKQTRKKEKTENNSYFCQDCDCRVFNGCRKTHERSRKHEKNTKKVITNVFEEQKKNDTITKILTLEYDIEDLEKEVERLKKIRKQIINDNKVVVEEYRKIMSGNQGQVEQKTIVEQVEQVEPPNYENIPEAPSDEDLPELPSDEDLPEPPPLEDLPPPLEDLPPPLEDTKEQVVEEDIPPPLEDIPPPLEDTKEQVVEDTMNENFHKRQKTIEKYTEFLQGLLNDIDGKKPRGFKARNWWINFFIKGNRRFKNEDEEYKYICKYKRGHWDTLINDGYLNIKERDKLKEFAKEYGAMDY